MKVLVFTSLYPNNIWPHHGVFVKERITHIAKLDACRVKVVAPVPYFPPIKISHRWPFSQVLAQESREGLEVYHPRYFITPKVGMVSYGLTMFLSVLPILKKIQHNFDFDVIDSHFVYPDGFAAVLLGRFFGKPVVVSARGSDINFYRELPLIRRLLRHTLCKANQVIAVSQALKAAMVRLEVPEEKIAVIPNGVDIDKFYPFPKEEARRNLNLPNKRVILSVGNLTANKGCDLLIKALKILRDEFREKDLYLVIIGEGKFRKILENIISALKLDEHVRLAGDIPHQELHLWYSAADLFCLASSREGWPNVLLEALACGTPVVATSTGGIPEIICSNTLGLLTKRDERDIAAGIALALKKPWQYAAMIQYARERTWDHVALAVSRIFKALLKGPNDLSYGHATCDKAIANINIQK